MELKVGDDRKAMTEKKMIHFICFFREPQKKKPFEQNPESKLFKSMTNDG